MTRIVGCLYRTFGGGVAGTTSTPVISSYTDNGDNSGAVLTLTDVSSSATVTVYYSRFNGLDECPLAWTSGGSRVGNGTLDLDLTAGHYQVYPSSQDTNGAVAQGVPAYITVTDGLTSRHLQCIIAAQARIQALGLSGLDSDNVIWRELPLDRLIGAGTPTTFPCVLLTPKQVAMPPRVGTVNLDDVTYGVLATIIAADNQETTMQAGFSTYSLWSQQIAMAFRQRRLPGVTASIGDQVTPTIINAMVEPAQAVIPEAWSANLFATANLLKFVSREPRGF